jgi:transposase
MPRRRTVTELREIIIRLKKGCSVRAINRALGVHRTIIREVRDRAQDEGWLDPKAPLPTEEQVQESVRGNVGRQTVDAHPLDALKELFRLWLEEGYTCVVMHQLIQGYYKCSYSTVRRYIQSRFPRHPRPVMRRIAKPGEVLELDFGYLGITFDPDSLRNRKTYLFSARFRFSRRTYREAVFDQTGRTFFLSHVHAFEYFGGVPEKLVMDNLKAAVIKASFESPLVNRAYRQLAEHYGVLIDPCAPYQARHKGGVESDVKYVKGNFWPLFKERQRQKGRQVPYADELREELERWNADVSDIRIIRGVGQSPRQLFEEQERSALKPLAPTRWDPVSWAEPSVGADWRVQFEKAFYTVPYQYIGSTVQVFGNSSTVRIYYDYKEITLHHRAKKPWDVVRKSEHAPPHQEEYMNATRESLLRWAQRLGGAVGQVAELIFSDKAVDGMRPVRALIRLADVYSVARLQNACLRALLYRTPAYQSVKNILVKGLDFLPAAQPAESSGQLHFRFQRPEGYFDPQGHQNSLN